MLTSIQSLFNSSIWIIQLPFQFEIVLSLFIGISRLNVWFNLRTTDLRFLLIKEQKCLLHVFSFLQHCNLEYSEEKCFGHPVRWSLTHHKGVSIPLSRGASHLPLPDLHFANSCSLSPLSGSVIIGHLESFTVFLYSESRETSFHICPSPIGTQLILHFYSYKAVNWEQSCLQSLVIV